MGKHIEGILNYLFLVIAVFVALSAIISGYSLITTNGLGMPISWLKNSGFTSFTIPGLILVFIIGGTHLLSAYIFIKNGKYKLESAGIAGFGLIIWIFTQLYLIKQASWLQVLYFSIGCLEIIISILLFRSKTGKYKE